MLRDFDVVFFSKVHYDRFFEKSILLNILLKRILSGVLKPTLFLLGRAVVDALL